MTSEQALLERAQAYDEQALGELYDRYAPRIYAYLYRRVHDAQLAEDLTSEVFVRMLRAIQSEWFWHTSFRAWLYRIAHNLAVDHYRRQGQAQVFDLEEQRIAAPDNPDSTLMEKLSGQRLRAAILNLTVDQQQVLALRFGEQLTARETAAVMGKTTGAVEALQHRALVALRQMLKEE
ncbi:MAG: sigma-70 family RNA polymerase sigma factor [Anaerolineae bacterium]|nr:sigma-70 family RNA polymerase sigma factor [Anaerolineae bacterium]